MTQASVASPRRRDSVGAERLPWLRALYLPSVAIGAISGCIVWVAVVHLAHQRDLGSVLSAGWAELAAPGLIVLLVLAVGCEQLWPAERHETLARGRVQDGCFLILYATTVVPLMTLLGVGFAALMGSHARWIEIGSIAHWPLWVLIAITLVAMDAANWIAHYADHRIAPLWRLHAMHHSQEELNVLTAFRAHPLVHTTGFMLATVPVVALMGDRAIAPVLITTYVCLGTLPHANVKWTFGPLGRLVVSPAYHRLHHATDGVQGNNLGIVLTIWDVMAGRAQFPVPGAPACRTGLEGRPLAVEQSTSHSQSGRFVVSALFEPFLASRPR